MDEDGMRPVSDFPWFGKFFQDIRLYGSTGRNSSMASSPQNLCHSSRRILHRIKLRNENDGGVGNPDSPGKWPIRQAGKKGRVCQKYVIMELN